MLAALHGGLGGRRSPTLKDASLEDSENLPEPGVIAREIVEDLEAALEQFRLIAEDLGEPAQPRTEAD